MAAHIPTHIANQSFTPEQLVGALGGQLQSQFESATQIALHNIAPLALAKEGDISFLSDARYAKDLHHSQASCVILSANHLAEAQSLLARGGCAIVVDQAYLYFAQLTQWWRARSDAQTPGIHPSAVIDPSAKVHASASIGALCVVGAHAVVGADTRLAARVTVGERCEVGQRCIIHSGAVIGADGFGFAPRPDKSWEKIEQLGTVRISNNVEIGANTCIDRGALGDTVIEEGVKLDNLIQIGHNVRIGKHTAMAANVGVAGSATIGAYCQIGGGAGILGHLSIADHVIISACTTVTRSITEPGQYTGIFPIDKNSDWEKNAVTLRQLHQLRDRLRALEKKHNS
jgi:UDP-3-O-[3-hydroxymyristoyl] glucosamine N-acyltransferase